MDHAVERLLSKHLENAKAIFRLHKSGIFSAEKERELENKDFLLYLFFGGAGGEERAEGEVGRDN